MKRLVLFMMLFLFAVTAQAQNFDRLCNRGVVSGAVTLNGTQCGSSGLSSGLYKHFKMILTGNVSLSVQNLLTGLYVVELTQDGTGGRAVSFSSDFTDAPAALVTTAGDVTRLTMWWNGAKMVVLSTERTGGVLSCSQMPALSGDVTSAGGTCVVTVEGEGGASSTVFNVKTYGAVGDGVTNDTAAIAATITAAGNNSTVYFPAGVYSTSGHELTGLSGVTFRGQGPTSILKRRPGGGNDVPILEISTSTNIVVEYLGIDLNNCLNYCAGVAVQSVDYYRIQFNKIFDSNINTTNTNDKFGILAQGVVAGTDSPGYILFNILEDTQLEMDRVSNVLVQGNKVIRPRFTAGIGSFTNSGSTPSVSRNVQIIDNVVQDAEVSCASICVVLDPASDNDFHYSDYRIAGNTILYSITVTDERTGIKIGTNSTVTSVTGAIFRNFQITDNHIWAHETVFGAEGFHGIALASSTTTGFVFEQFTIAGNTIMRPDSAGAGMDLRRVTYGVIRDNRIDNIINAGAYGISLLQPKHVYFYNNTIQGNVGKGFLFEVSNAYDEDVRSWGNTIGSVTERMSLENEWPNGEYWLEDMTAGGDAVQAVTAVSDTISTWAGVMTVTLNAPYTMTSTPTLVAGHEGQRVLLLNTSANRLTLQDELQLTGTRLFLQGATVAVAQYEMIALRYVPALDGWVQEQIPSANSPITTSHKMWLPAAACQDATATLLWDVPTADPPVAGCVTGTNIKKGVADFSDGNNLSMQLTLMLPSDWTGAIDASFSWFSAGTSGNVVWQLATVCAGDGETDDPAFNTASVVIDAAKGTTNQLNNASITGLVTTGCAAGELMHVKAQRDSAHASDTLAATARLVGVELTIRRIQ